MDNEKAMESGFATFKEEAAEILDSLEELLLDMADHEASPDMVRESFRLFHTFKGACGMFDLKELVTFTHEIENILDLVRNGTIALNDDMRRIFLSAVDFLRDAMAEIKPGQTIDDSEPKRLISSLRCIVKTGPETQTPDSTQHPPSPAFQSKAFRLLLSPSEDVFFRGIDPLNVIDELKGIGQCYVLAKRSRIPDLLEIDPERCYTDWDVLLITDRDENQIRDHLGYAVDTSTMQLQALNSEQTSEAYGSFGCDMPSAPILVLDGPHHEAHEGHMDAYEKHAHRADSTVRVSSKKLDSLVDLVGELVTIQAGLTQRVEAWQLEQKPVNPEELYFISQSIEHLVSGLHGSVMGVRMVPLWDVSRALKRLVGDLSAKLGKCVTFVATGQDTELDKSMVERLPEPLMHLIRNCIDHGIEPPDEREAMGKPREGTITVSATQEGVNVVITVSDDGKGIDYEAVRAKAEELGLIQRSATISNKELRELIFSPALSTRKVASDLSGRGVGMDAVRKCIDSMRGSVEVDSQIGKGTVFTIKLPITLAIIDGMLVRVGEEYFVFPMAIVESCLEIDNSARSEHNGRQLIEYHGSLVPYVRLRERFCICGERPQVEQVVLVHVEDTCMGFVVDVINGKNQTVLKSLNKIYRHVQCISGVTVLGNGSMAFILDASKLYKETLEAQSQGNGKLVTA